MAQVEDVADKNEKGHDEYSLVWLVLAVVS